MNQKVITIRINDKKILEYLKDKENVSQYIRNLIKKDMQTDGELSEEVKRLIKEYIEKNMIKPF